MLEFIITLTVIALWAWFGAWTISYFGDKNEKR
jgi:hypothetical protein